MSQSSYVVPGVYVEESNALALSIQGGDTAVPVFIGHFNSKNQETEGCIRIESWLAFTSLFHSSVSAAVKKNNTNYEVDSKCYVGSYSVRLYFENGGGACYVVNLPDDVVEANKVLPQVMEWIDQCPDVTLLCYCEHEAGSAGIEDQAVYDQLGTLLTAEPRKSLGRFLLADAWYNNHGGSTPSLTAPHFAAPSQAAVYFPALKTNYRFEVDDSLVSIVELWEIVDANTLAELRERIQEARTALKDARIDEKATQRLVSTDLVAERGLSDQNKRTTAQSKTNADYAAATKAVQSVKDAEEKLNELLATFSSIRAAVDASVASLPVVLRASVAMAGVYARTDREHGVWKAPANVALSGVADLMAGGDPAVTKMTELHPIRVDDTLNQALVVKKINAIRAFRGQGIVVWGARTMVDPAQTDWLYIPVRRLFNTVERDASAALRVAAFETNSGSTWEVMRSALDNYLYALWRQGGLMGATAAEAYYVHIGSGITMTEADIKAGRMIVRIGLAAIRPAEFIVMQLTQNVASG